MPFLVSWVEVSVSDCGTMIEKSAVGRVTGKVIVEANAASYRNVPVMTPGEMGRVCDQVVPSMAPQQAWK